MKETFAQWEKRMRALNGGLVIHTILNSSGGVVFAWCENGEWSDE